jgi:transcriptional regulator of heat shock response
MPEFYDYQLTNSLFSALERFDFWTEVLSRATDPLDILMGEEFIGRGDLSQCSFIYHRFDTPHVKGTIGVVGPSRLNYPYVVPIVRYMGDLITELGANW